MITLSFFRKVYFDKNRQLTVLHQSKVTDYSFHYTFRQAVESIKANATYPTPQSNKWETYAWTPTLFETSINEKGEEGMWRVGAHVADTLSLFIADLDNQHANRTMIDFDTVAETLASLGLPHFLYTSFSHTPERHKVRIVIPTDRDLTPDEAFRVFLWFNTVFDRQLDGSIYDPGDFLYGPPHGGRTLTALDGEPLCVDAFLALSDALPEEDRTCVTRGTQVERRPMTEADTAIMRDRWNSHEQTEGVSIFNPTYFNPEWFNLLASRYIGDSRHQTVLGLLTKAWLKSGRTLTHADLITLQSEMDRELGGYLQSQYGRQILEDDLRAVMKIVSSDKPKDEKAERIARNIKRLENKRKAA